ncbi:MAG: NAD(P)/FAD-dependent oxidoreductase [Chloroflexi bacterium]|nr:NAD(P)/FAD-dependent oxidoreductase [Chloroflexota bacterium]
MRVAVVGGGLAGLTAAYRLGQRGHQVSLFEAHPFLGGQAAAFVLGGAKLDAFYHHIFTSDIDIINIIQELGLGDRLQWLPSRVGFFHGGRVYDFTTPWDLLRFRPLSLVNRLRLGLASLRLQRDTQWRQYETITARDWIVQHLGREIYEVVWGPLLRGKFGPRAEEVAMVWLWGKLHLRFGSRSRGLGQERLGYLRGSFQLVADALAEGIRKQGGAIHLESPAQAIAVKEGRTAGVVAGGREHPAEAVIATVPSPAMLQLAPSLPQGYRQMLEQARYQAALCLVLSLKQSLTPIYWLNIADPTVPFVAAIEHTNLVDKSEYGGRHILYLSNYLDPKNPLFGARVEELLMLYLPHLSRLNPRFRPDWVEEAHLFREAAGQPVITTGYGERIPPHRTPIPGLYLANTTQIYPQDRGISYSIRLGDEVARLAEEGAAPGI